MFKPEPSGNYIGLLRQFNAMTLLVNSQQEMIKKLTEINGNLTTQIGLASLDELESQRQANHTLTNELESKEKNNG